MKKIKDLIKKNKKIAIILAISLIIMPIILISWANNFSANVIELSWNSTNLEKWKELVIINDSLKEIQNWNKIFFDAFNLRFLKFWEIIDEKIESISSNKYRLSFLANTTGDSLHEYVYFFEFNDWKLIRIKEIYN